MKTKNNIWIISPYSSEYPHIFDKVWKFNLENNLISLGWHELGDIAMLTKDEISVKYLDKYNKTASSSIKGLYNFYHSISVGDTIIARKGQQKIIAIGTVLSPAFYDEEIGKAPFDIQNPEDKHPHLRKVVWKVENYDFKENIFERPTVQIASSKAIIQLKKLNLNISPSAIKLKEYYEGTCRQITTNKYERNPEARKKCLEKYGFICSVCQMNFKERYGEIGENFIHIHHLELLSSKGKKHKVDPENDLRPVCPNCHAMLHQKSAKEPYTIEELRSRLRG